MSQTSTLPAPDAATKRALKSGSKLMGQGRYEEAISAFEEGLQSAPSDPNLLFALGNAARAIGHLEAAVAFYNRVLTTSPNQIEAISNLAAVYRQQSKHEEATLILQSALNVNPGAPQLWHAIGNVRREMGDAESAETFFSEALRLKSTYPEALGNMADLIHEKGDLETALAYYGKAIGLSPQNAQLHVNRGVMQLSHGNLTLGWRDYEWRTKVPEKAVQRDHGLKRWAGQSLVDKRLLVCAEQGIGDQVLFASCFAELIEIAAKANATCVFECEKRLVPLFKRSFPGAKFYPQNVTEQAGQRSMSYDWLKSAGGADFAVEMGSLPRTLRPTVESFPKENTYLKVASTKKKSWDSWLKGLGEKKKVGVCWRSGDTSGQRALQFAPLDHWGDLMSSDQYTYINLQYDACDEERREVEKLAGHKIHNPPNIDQKNDIDEVIALMSSLDAVVSAPTAVPVFSGAAGVPTLKIVYQSSWTALGQNYEPFTPACRIIQPDQTGDWKQAMSKTKTALPEIIAGMSS